MGVAQLGDLRWRVDPQSINWSYQVDANQIETLGGQVVQILGATLSDLTIQGQFGQDHASKLESWQLAAAFNLKVKAMMDAQTLPAKTVGASSVVPSTSDAAVVHQPLTFSYLDGTHDWSFKVLVKSISDGDGNGQLNHSTGKFSYTYALTLFIVEADTDLTKTIASDAFISNIANGLGWAQTKFNGQVTAAAVQAFLAGNGGGVTAYLDNTLTGGATS